MMTLCARCGMRADVDPAFHFERYGHWPQTPEREAAGCVEHERDPGYCRIHLAYCYLADLSLFAPEPAPADPRRFTR